MKNIIILGAGFGGLRAALDIDQGFKKHRIEDHKVILVDRLPHHTFTPLLYEVTTVHSKYFKRELLEKLVAFNVAQLIKNTDIEFQEVEVLNIDLHGKKITLKSGVFDFEYLVIALGSEVIYFGIPGLKENSFHLKTFEDAFGLRSKLETLSSNARITIGGGGGTGIELAAEISKFSKNQKKNFHITILEATPTLLPGFDLKVIKKVYTRLMKLGVESVLDKPVASADFKSVTLKDGAVVLHDLLIWTGGVGASNLTEQVSNHIKKGEKNRIEISSDLTCKPQDLNSEMHGYTYAIGDIACILNPESKRMVPLVARAAIEEGKVVARNIVESIKNKEKNRRKYEYKPKEYPYIIPVGGKFAVAKIGPFILSGFLGWILKILVELNYFREVMPLLKAKKLWFKTLKVFSAND